MRFLGIPGREYVRQMRELYYSGRGLQFGNPSLGLKIFTIRSSLRSFMKIRLCWGELIHFQFENEIAPGVLQLTAQKVCTLQEIQRHKELATENVLILPLLSGILTGYVFIERWTRSL